MSKVLEAADAIVAALNGGSFSQSFVAERSYRPRFDLQDMKELRVTVVPSSNMRTIAGRMVYQSDVTIDIGVQKKLSGAGDEELDGLMGMVEEIAAFIEKKRQFGDVLFVSAGNAPVYSQEHLTELRQFTSVIQVTLRLVST